MKRTKNFSVQFEVHQNSLNVNCDMQLEWSESERNCSLESVFTEPSGFLWQPRLRCLKHGEKGKDVILGVD